MDDTWQDRVINEQAALAQKLKDLRRFISGDPFKLLPGYQQHLMRSQQDAMAKYDSILRERIDLFD